MKSVLQFESYYFDQMVYKRNDEYWNKFQPGQPVSIEIQPTFEFGVQINKDNPHNARVIVSVSLGKDQLSSDYPFQIEAGICGIFNVAPDDSDPQELWTKFSGNAIAILYPYLRSAVTDITSKSDHPPVILPVLNVAKIAAEKLRPVEPDTRDELEKQV